jgi:hypothetical protein
MQHFCLRAPHSKRPVPQYRSCEASRAARLRPSSSTLPALSSASLRPGLRAQVSRTQQSSTWFPCSSSTQSPPSASISRQVARASHFQSSACSVPPQSQCTAETRWSRHSTQLCVRRLGSSKVTAQHEGHGRLVKTHGLWRKRTCAASWRALRSCLHTRCTCNTQRCGRASFRWMWREYIGNRCIHRAAAWREQLSLLAFSAWAFGIAAGC